MAKLVRLAALVFLPVLVSGPLGCQGGDDMSDPSLSCVGGSEKSLVMTKFSFARQMPAGVSYGFQLIDHVAEKGDPATCGHASLTDPEGRTGINNQLSVLMEDVDVVTNGAEDAEVQGAINSGMLLFGVRIPNFPSQPDASCVDIEFRMLTGKPSVGTDMRLDPNQTFDTQPTAMVSTVRGTMKGGVIEAGPFELVLPIQIQDAPFKQAVHSARIRLTLGADGTASAVMGGIIDKADFLTQFQKLPLPHLTDVLPVLLDTIADLDPDPMSHDCHQFSAAFLFDAKNAFINPGPQDPAHAK